MSMNPLTWLSIRLAHAGGFHQEHDVVRLRALYMSLLRQVHISSENLSTRSIEDGGRGVFLRRFMGLQRDNSRIYGRDDVAVAFRMLASSVAGTQHDADVETMETLLTAQRIARRIEASVVRVIREIGETVVYSQRPRSSEKARDELTFAYFCDKAILPLLVGIAKALPTDPQSAFHGVVWSAKVKAQVLRTINFLVSGVKDKTSLYFLLSHHSINHLILSFLPLSKWNDPALKDMLSAYAELLKTLSIQLGAYPDLFLPFFTLQTASNEVTSFPLFSAILQIANSSYTQSASYVHATCLNLVVGLLRISDAPIRAWITSAQQEQDMLCDHMCSQLLERFEHMAGCTTGPIVDAVRHTGLVAQVAAWDDVLDVLHDTFWCNITPLNTRLCERLLRTLIRPLLLALAPPEERPFLVVAVTDCDVVPDLEARAQAATFLLSRLFLKLQYPPFLRMLAVALFHPELSNAWSSSGSSAADDSDDLTSALNNVVLGDSMDTCPNEFRQEVAHALSGNYGEWRFISAAALMETAVFALDFETLEKVYVVPSTECPSDHALLFEGAVSEFMAREHAYKSVVSVVALECASSLLLEYMRKVLSNNKLKHHQNAVGESLLLMQVLESTKHYFFHALLESQTAIEAKDALVRAVEAAVMGRYTTLAATDSFSYPLIQHCATGHNVGAECLARKLRGVPVSDAERLRFLASMAIHFRAVCRIASRDGWYEQSDREPLSLVDPAQELGAVFGFLMHPPKIGADINLRDRQTFPFTAQVYNETSRTVSETEQEQTQSLSENMIFRSRTTGLILVVDPTILLVVKPYAGGATGPTTDAVGTVVCSVPLVHVVAAAADDERLHVAVRHDNVGFLIKNGNMLLTFESPGTCLVACQYLERCRQLLQTDLCGKIVRLFTPLKAERLSPKELSHSRTF